MKRSTGNKYRARKCVIDGITFDSLLEGRHYQELRLREKAGEVFALKVHTRHPLYSSNRELVGEYEDDFSYYDQHGEYHVVDCKGFITPLSRWKIRHFEAQYGRKVQIVTKARRRAA